MALLLLLLVSLIGCVIGHGAICGEGQFRPPAHWRLDPWRCYRAFPRPVSFELAAVTCLRQNGTIPLLEDERERQMLEHYHPNRDFPTAWAASGHCVLLKPEAQVKPEGMAERCKRNVEAPFSSSLSSPLYCLTLVDALDDWLADARDHDNSAAHVHSFGVYLGLLTD